ncbi:NADP-dependent oxidoreductase domain-containing protein [Syncephalis fuscata]|nr:NADP-dependent oxidoreductase domain-containing protein [Syncephalis fuscata]
MSTNLDDFPSFCFGAGVFSGAYNSITETNAYAAIEQALERGVRMFDTAPYYGRSEIILGKALQRVAKRFPRDQYLISTKIGRYGPKRADFDYSASRVRQSIKESCDRLGVDKLDIVFCHDVEFVSEAQVLDEALPALFELKEQGLIGRVGISGYPLDVLLSIAEKQAARNQPLDILLSYCHYTLQSTLLKEYSPRFRATGISRIINASPLSMGLFRDADPPEWHPASQELRQTARHCAALCHEQGCSIADIALYFSMQFTGADTIIVGCSTPEELDCALDRFMEIHGPNQSAIHSFGTNNNGYDKAHYTSCLKQIQLLLAPYHNVSWASPPPDA